MIFLCQIFVRIIFLFLTLKLITRFLTFEKKTNFGTVWTSIETQFLEDNFLVMMFISDLLVIFESQPLFEIENLEMAEIITADFLAKTVDYKLLKEVVASLTTDVAIQTSVIESAVFKIENTGIVAADIITNMVDAFETYTALTYHFFSYNLGGASDEGKLYWFRVWPIQSVTKSLMFQVLFFLKCCETV